MFDNQKLSLCLSYLFFRSLKMNCHARNYDLQFTIDVTYNMITQFALAEHCRNDARRHFHATYNDAHR